MKLINEAEVFETWAPMLEEQTGINESAKLGWMTKYCHYHSLNEAFTYPAAGLLNTPGMGNVTPAGAAAGGAGAFYGDSTTGSGDKFPSLLPLAIQVAARTVGFDIVPVIPMNGPGGVLTYLDYVYAGGKQPFGAPPGTSGAQNPGGAGGAGINSYTDLPLTFKIKLALTVAIPANVLVEGTDYALGVDGVVAGNGSAILATYIGKSRVDGQAIFRTVSGIDLTGGAGAATADTTLTLGGVIAGAQADVLATTGTLAGADLVVGTVINDLGTNTASLVKALEDHIQGFAGAGPDDSNDWQGNFSDGLTSYEPMRRGVGEEQYYRTMGLQAFTKFVEAETYQVAATVTTEQIQDLNRQYGIDVISMVENALVNDISQSINKHILSRAFALGWSNNQEFLDVQGANLNLNISNGLVAAGAATGAYIGKDAVGVAGVFPAEQDFAVGSATGMENQSSVQRRVYSKVLAAGNVVAQRGRRGPANFVVCNLQLGTALQDSAQFSWAPMANTVNQNNGSLYPIGTVAGMTVYVDPNMAYSDNRILVGRKGADEEPGLKFMPYLMAESIQTIAEGTMAPKIAVKSRYALVEAGHHPQTQYFTLAVAVGGGGLV
jgi:hypothetical protein